MRRHALRKAPKVGKASSVRYTGGQQPDLRLVGDRRPGAAVEPAVGTALEQAGWSRLSIRTTRFPGHPQETTENSVDLGHLRYVHGYDNVGRNEPVSIDGPYFESRFEFKRTRTMAKVLTLTFDVSAVTRIFGLGYSFVDVSEHSIGMDIRMWVLAAPVDGRLIDITLVSQVREIRNPKRQIAGLSFLPMKMRAPIINKFMAAQQHQDVLQDVVIWSKKRYQPRPRLCRSDGEIMRFRRYCAQFYPDPDPCDLDSPPSSQK